MGGDADGRGRLNLAADAAAQPCDGQCHTHYCVGDRHEQLVPTQHRTEGQFASRSVNCNDMWSNALCPMCTVDRWCGRQFHTDRWDKAINSILRRDQAMPTNGTCGGSACARAEEECNEEFEPDANNSAAGVLFLFLVHWSVHRDKDILTGLPLDFSMRPHSPRKPTLVAHQAHHVPLNFGFDRPLPTDLSHFDQARVNARVELWPINRTIRAWRRPVIEAMFDSARECVLQTIS